MNTKLVGNISATTRSRLAWVGVDSSMLEAARLLMRAQVSLVVVCTANGTMAGIITKTDLVRELGRCDGRSGTTPSAAQIMVRDVFSCGPEDSLVDLMATMARQGLVHVPVLDEQSRPIGVVNARDALRELWAEEAYEDSLLRDYVMGIGYH